MVLKSRPVLRWLVHLGSWLPLLWLVWQWQTANLGANPVQSLTQHTGRFAVVWLLLTLACTPAYLLGLQVARDFRRTLGLYTFFNACLHFLTFTVLDYGLRFDLLLPTILEQRFILLGLAGLLILALLAITSNKRSIKHLNRYWKPLHRTIYLAGVIILLHAAWARKYDRRLIFAYAAIFAVLMLFRIPAVQKWLRVRKNKPKPLPNNEPAV
jgi:sulfoxide reductase heme-binding subunit YedZ